MTATPQRTAVYRAFDADDALLYVAMTESPHVRFGAHSTIEQWWSDVHRVSLTWYDTRIEAAEAEIDAIRTEGPKWNIAVPDENGRRTGVGRPPWAPDGGQETLLAALKRIAKHREDVEAAYRKLLADCDAPDIPIARLAAEVGVERKTIYRHLGKPMK